MHLDPFMPVLTAIALATLLLGAVLKKLRQPHVIGYLLAGVLLGPHMLGVVTDLETVSQLGSIGVVMLLFFIGMEISPHRLAENWKIAVIGTLLQVALSVGVITVLGRFLDWPLARIVLLGFVISLSSTAVVLKLLQDWNELDTRAGQNALGILLAQDLAVIPMLIVIGMLGGEPTSPISLASQIVGGIAIIVLAVLVVLKGEIRLPLLDRIGNDHEMQVFAALAICFGLALITSLMNLSSALGAFVAGMIVAAGRETHWVHRSLNSFKVLFIALFFLSIGMLIDLRFVGEHFLEVGALVVGVFLINTAVNAVIIRAFGCPWSESLYVGSVLSQAGEFGFILAAVGLHAAIITQFAYQTTISVIALSLMLSPVYILLMRKTLGWRASE